MILNHCSKSPGWLQPTCLGTSLQTDIKHANDYEANNPTLIDPPHTEEIIRLPTTPGPFTPKTSGHQHLRSLLHQFIQQAAAAKAAAVRTLRSNLLLQHYKCTKPNLPNPRRSSFFPKRNGKGLMGEPPTNLGHGSARFVIPKSLSNQATKVCGGERSTSKPSTMLPPNNTLSRGATTIRSGHICEPSKCSNSNNNNRALPTHTLWCM